MAHYKIVNITGKLPKRHINKDMILKIEYHVGFHKKYKDLNAGGEILLTCRTLPVSIHNLRAKKLITIKEISENEFVRLQKPSAKKIPVATVKKSTPKKPVITKVAATDIEDVVKKEKPKRKSTRKKAESTATIKSEE